MPFQEYTLSNEDNMEVMVHIDTKTGKVLRLYCYKNEVPIVYNETTGKEYKLRTKPNILNELFVNISGKSNIYKLLIKNNFIFIGIDEENKESFEQDIAIIEKSLSLYQLSSFTPYFN